MKYLLSILLSLSVLCTSLSAVEYGILIEEQSGLGLESVTLLEGDVFEILSYGDELNDPSKVLLVYYANSTDILLYNSTFSTIRDSLRSNYGHHISTFVGPATITLTDTDGNTSHKKASITYKLTRASEVEYKNVNIVALPSATVGAGTHEIVVEASDDLQTWTPVHSSSIGGNKAFFRTRVVEAGE